MKKIPISAAEYIGKKYNQRQVIILCADDEELGLRHTVTWGKDKENCRQAAYAGEIHDSFISNTTIDELIEKLQEMKRK